MQCQKCPQPALEGIRQKLCQSCFSLLAERLVGKELREHNLIKKGRIYVVENDLCSFVFKAIIKGMPITLLNGGDKDISDDRDMPSGAIRVLCWTLDDEIASLFSDVLGGKETLYLGQANAGTNDEPNTRAGAETNENPNRPKGRGIFTNSWDFQSCEYPSKKTIEVYPTFTSDGVFATNKGGIKLFLPLTDKELSIYAEAKGFIFTPKPKKGIKAMLDSLEEKHPETRFSVAASAKELAKIIEKKS